MGESRNRKKQNGENKMDNVPRNVFRVCPENVQTTAPVPSVQTKDFKIFRRSNGELLRVCKEQITIDDLKKAARCARYTGEFRVYSGSAGNYKMLTASDFPIRKNVYVTEAVTRSNASPATKTKIFSVCESTSTPPARTTRTTTVPGIKIFKKVNKELLRVCQSQITLDDLKKAAKCANYKLFKAYDRNGVMLEKTDIPAPYDVYISQAYDTTTARTNKTKIFSICESTSVPPVRTTITPVVPVVSPKKKLLRKAIDALQVATRALEELYTTI
jgi:hypothetical protein